MTLDVLFFDVQHGSCAYIKTPNNRHVLHDLGSGSYQDGEEFSPIIYLKDQLRKKGIDKLDKVIITHPHKDHIDDILNLDVLSPKSLHRPPQIPHDKIMENVREEDKPIFEKYCQIDDRYCEPLSAENDLKNPMNTGGAVIRTFSPNSCSLNDFNSHSLVTTVSYAKSKIMLSGDNNPCSWRELLDDTDFKKELRGVDIFLTPHHGRESGWLEELFDYMQPKLTIVSDGKHHDTNATNRYSDVSSGWKVHSRSNGEQIERKCLTTRNDGIIFVRLGIDNETPFIYVTIK